MKKILFVLIIALSLNATQITLGVVPQQSPLKLSKKWSKVTEYLYNETGIEVIFKTERSIPKFEKALYAGVYDISYMNPYHFIVANKAQNYEAFTRANKNIVGIVLAKDEKVEFTKENLAGQRFLFPAPNAFAATLLPKLEFKEKFGIDIDKDTKVLYVNSHDSVYKGISRDIGYLGGGIVRTFNNFTAKNDKEKLNIVYKTSPYPSHPIAAHPRISKEIVLKIQKAFIDMPSEIKKTLSIKAFKTIDSSEYDIIKSLAVDSKRD